MHKVTSQHPLNSLLSFIFLLTLIAIIFDRNLHNNQLKDLPQDIFHKNAQLLRLWGHLFI